MRLSGWIDHVPPWLAYGSVMSTGIYEPVELVVMAVPLLVAALAEWRRWDLAPWRRGFELLALAGLAGLAWARIGMVPAIVVVLFLLCGIRLCLPRDLGQRRQLLLMGFLIWITTAISTFEINFLLWSILWVAGTALALTQQAWDGSANRKGAPLQGAPYRKVPGWTLGAALLAIVFFASLPRISLGFRAFPWGVAGLTATQAGLSDSLELEDAGPIAPSGELVLRVLPPTPDPSRYAASLALLRGIALESLDHQRWSPGQETPAVPYRRLYALTGASTDRIALEYFVAPSPSGILPFPYGRLWLVPPEGMPVQDGQGGSLRWMYPSRRPIPLRFMLEPAATLAEPPLTGRRRALLTDTSEGTESAERYGRRVVPGEASAREAAERLTTSLRTFQYTLANPSGGAANPLQDFLERSRAGHCEYFASALALMLRYRGIPARVVNGYRLGPWISEGGYWLVTQNEAHSWVEYYDDAALAWRVADATPAAPPAGLEIGTFWAAFQRWTDAIRFRWDRHVVRFSDQDQLAGVEWVHARLAGLPDWRPGRRTMFSALLLGLAGLVAWAAWRSRPLLARAKRKEPERGLKALKPLLRAAGRSFRPSSGETARRWLLRLSWRVPEQAAALARLADEVDAVAYGGGDPRRLKGMVKAEARLWRRVVRS